MSIADVILSNRIVQYKQLCNRIKNYTQVDTDELNDLHATARDLEKVIEDELNNRSSAENRKRMYDKSKIPTQIRDEFIRQRLSREAFDRYGSMKLKDLLPIKIKNQTKS